MKKSSRTTLSGQALPESVKTIRSVERAFEVLHALRELKDASVAELETKTGLSRPTLLRILKTLMEMGAVRRGLKDRRFRNRVFLNDFTEQYTPGDQLADIAAPFLERLCSIVQWPSMIGVYGDDNLGDYMLALESTATMTRFYVNRLNKKRVNLLMSAQGGAFLAQLEPLQLDLVVEHVRHSTRDHYNLLAIALGDLEARLDRVRERGYALRHPQYLGGTYNGVPTDDGMNTFAVPLIGHGKVFGAATISWNRRAMTAEQAIENHLSELQKAAKGIAIDAEMRGIVDYLTF
jgi:IclR family mhp operon transcriptional activator